LSNLGVLTIVDDSHSHTGATISGLDISEDTNLAVSGTLLQLVDDTLNIKEGTLTNAKYCTYSTANGLVCNSEGVAAETNALETTITGILDTEMLIGNGNDSAVYVAMSGDATLSNLGVLTIADDSHSHTGTTISGLDVSEDTNLATSGTLLQLVDDTLSVKEGTLTNTKYCTYSTVNGLVCNSDATAGSPPGADTQVIINDGGVYGADSGLTYLKSTDVLTAMGGLVTGDGTLKSMTFLTYNIPATPVTFRYNHVTGTVELNVPFSAGGSSHCLTLGNGESWCNNVDNLMTLAGDTVA